MVTQKDGGLVARAVREALGTLVSPAVYEQLVGRALAAAGLSEIPESGRAIAAWIEGPLQREIEGTVGADAAELVAAQLAPIVAHASASAVVRQPEPARRDAFGSEQPTGVVAAAPARGGRPDLARTARVKLSPDQMKKLRDGDPGDTSRPEAPSPSSDAARAQQVVFTASADSAAVDSLRVYLAGSMVVVRIDDLVGLLDALEEPGLLEPILLLDCRRPTVHVTSIAAIGEDLPRGTSIVLWGATEDAWRELDRDRLPHCRWVRCSHEATTDDVGSLCAMLVGGAPRS